MANRLSALSDLQGFSKFGDASDILKRMQKKVDEINKYNKDSAGNDDIGKQYHQTVDQPTSDLTDLLGQVSDALEKVRQSGKSTSDLFNSSDQDLADNVNGS
ncbi:hypothetical protein OG500_11840 [Kitasatospora sp. NBC_01250]|uniref:hypothetical protein n=1 Tax=unclassified Kitasatospora TaxID=2633591 RepID=UPI002E1157F5|nr:MULTISPECIES: hypothetical protein [unclassified Kitasatospora]WSJ66823.1 hypothetical protein OG294_12280 [Kitasatospora sp. NBC_01302]